MSKRETDDLGLGFSDLPFSVIIGAIAVILWGIVNITGIWFPSQEIAVIQTVVYFIVIFAAITIIIDFFNSRGERR